MNDTHLYFVEDALGFDLKIGKVLNMIGLRELDLDEKYNLLIVKGDERISSPSLDLRGIAERVLGKAGLGYEFFISKGGGI